MCDLNIFKKKPQVTQIVQTAFANIKAELEGFGIHYMMNQDTDRVLYNTTLYDWERILPYLSVSAPKASATIIALTSEAWNCDEYSKASSVKAADFRLDSLEAWGSTPYKSEKNPTGRHAFNMVRIDKGEYMIYEPNVNMKEHGRLHPLIGNSIGYEPDGWRI